MTSLYQRTASGLKWSTIERFASQGISFAITIFIARILSPSDYGIIGMIMIFIEISGVFVGGGFGAALIRKQNRTDADLSTVFYYNIAVSLFFYLLLFLTAPFIAGFYKVPVLTSVVRIVGLNVIIGAFGAIQSTLLNIRIDFKTQTKISVISLLISGITGIVMALKGFGVWTLVTQSLLSTFISSVLLWFFVKWQPKRIFSKKSFGELFGFGSKLMFSGLLDTTYTNIYQVVIGRLFSTAELGFYTRARGLVQLPSSNITSVIQRVTFPVLSELQDDLAQLERNYRKLLRMSAFVIFPMMMLLFGVSKPLVQILLTDKWLPAVPYLQILCFSSMLYPIHAINLNLLQVKGRSDLFLKLEIIKKTITTIVLFATAPFGVLVMCYGIVFTSGVALIINTFYTGKLIQVGFFIQIRDIFPMLVLSVASGIAARMLQFVFEASYIQLLSGVLAGALIYIGGTMLFIRQEWNWLLKFIKM